ncbi:MAG: phospholipid/cholesterol/gamma-HCH transport system ATP-binding protein [Verrucomicrobiota bacterium]|jgi:phospholipid/cholesterol/gamma-HCH transport system ATP-binding protein|nr:phospholipid/cholesterol/gamma-HCH transport system ATP-binding protein [Verrucomicrobiota bacterium]MDK2963767.1 phospholipid/cholesterol/gamma-HCH transport system ATP-binding protein [Verrucomicrobiota bacterium]
MITFEKVTKRFGGKTVLNEISFEVPRGETFVIVGLSGAGKSVTIKHMVRLLTPDSGIVRIGNDVISSARGAELERIRGRFGVLFQGAALLQWLTVFENVALPLREHTKMSEEEVEKTVMEKLRMLNMEDSAEMFPADLSGGMQKRVGLARAIVMDPEIILYDEPTSGLDPVTSRLIDQRIKDLRRELGMTSVVVTHDLHSALSIGTHIMMIDDGRIVENAVPKEFIQSKNKTVQQFLESQYITRRGEWEKGMDNHVG